MDTAQRPEKRHYASIGYAVLVFALIKVVSITGIINEYWQRVLDQSLITMMGAVGLSLIYGFAGQFSLAHAGFYGIGAYTAGVIGKVAGHGSIPMFLVALVAGACAAGIVALAVGLPILRLKSDYLGIATLGFGVIVKVAMDNSDKIYAPFGGATGMTGVPQIVTIDWIFGLGLLLIVLTRNFILSGFGRAFMTIREDDIAAGAMGINPARIKTMAFVLGSAIAGLAGGLYAYRYPYLHPTSFDFLKSFDFLLIVVLGGLGSLSGTLFTAVAWVFLLEGLRIFLGDAFVDWRGVIYSLILVITILSRPQGLFGGKEWRLLFPTSPKRVPEGSGTRASA